MESNYVGGIDVSVWQGEIDWVSVSQSAKFAFIRVGDQLRKDPRFDENWSKSKGLLPRGAYLFFRPKLSIDDQVRMLASCDGELENFLDVEVNDGVNNKDMTEAVRQFCLKYKEATGELVGIYTGVGFWNSRINQNSWAGKHTLWVANYGVLSPNLPREWKTWKYWQYSAKGKVAGIRGDVDMNYCNESISITIPVSGSETKQLTVDERLDRLERLARAAGWSL